MAQPYECLEEYVGLRGICETVDGLYLNDLPGIEARTLSNVATSEDVTGQEMFLRLRREAARITGQAFLRRLDEKFRVEEVAERTTHGRLDYKRLTTEAEFTMFNEHASTSLHIERLKVYADRAGSLQIDVNGTAETVAVEQGYNIIPRKDTGAELKVTLTGLDGLQIALAGGASAYGCNIRCGHHSHYTGQIAAEVTFAIRCDQILCLFAEDLAPATRSMLAVLLMESIEYSDRTNPLARNSKESAGRIRARIIGGEDPVTGIKNQSLWHQQLGSVVSRAKLSGPCVTCTELRYEENTP